MKGRPNTIDYFKIYATLFLLQIIIFNLISSGIDPLGKYYFLKTYKQYILDI